VPELVLVELDPALAAAGPDPAGTLDRLFDRLVA